MRMQHWQFAADLANTMNWKMSPEDFHYASTLEPDGCFVASLDAQPVGVATCIAYGKVSWFGNLIVDPKFRGKHIGSMLVEHTIEYLQQKGVETIGLYAYPKLKKFYSNVGFVADEEYSAFHAQKLNSPAQITTPRPIMKADLDRIVDFDRQCFGGDRRRLLESILLEEGNMGYFALETGRVVGYVAVKVYRDTAEVGPLVCRESDVQQAIALINFVLAGVGNREVYVWGVPKKQKALLSAIELAGFREEFSVTRMFLGKPLPQNCIHLAESLERG